MISKLYIYICKVCMLSSCIVCVHVSESLQLSLYTHTYDDDLFIEGLECDTIPELQDMSHPHSTRRMMNPTFCTTRKILSDPHLFFLTYYLYPERADTCGRRKLRIISG